MQKLSAAQMKTVIGGGDTQGHNRGDVQTGNRGETTNGNRGETGHGNRSACTALVQYRHSNSPIFSRVAACGAPATDDGGAVLSCNCS